LPFDRGVCLNHSSFANCAAHKLPIITTRGSTLESPFKDGENVLLCPPKNALALSDMIVMLIDDSALRVKLGENAGILANKCFSWSITTQRSIETFAGRPVSSLI
jgi:glycosyltransferase involved in cell wall biosynthesis